MPTLTVFSDRRSWRQIGGLRAWAGQVGWSLWWRIKLRRRARSHEPQAFRETAHRGDEATPPPSARSRAGAGRRSEETPAAAGSRR